MARSIEEIYQNIIAAKEAENDLNSLTSTSRRAIWRLWAYIVATAQATFEQLMGLEKDNVQAIVDAAPAGNAAWVQAQMFNFQYDATTPQIVQLNTSTFAYYYPTVNSTMQIITRCSVNRQIYNVVQIKVAKGTTPEALTSLEKAAAQSYIDTIGNVNANYQVISLDPDRLYVAAQVYYQGQYSAVIEANVIAAIEAYMANLTFNGVILVSDLETVIRGVAGVNDVVLNNVGARADATIADERYLLVENNTLIARNWQTVAGYIIQEDNSGDTFADTLTFIAQ
jgi:hypothetical protein